MGSRDKLLRAACETFGTKGYQATSVDDLLERAKVSPSNFYYHFKSKEDLAYEVLDETIGSAREKFRPLFSDAALPAREKLQRLGALFVKRMTDNGCCGGCPMGNLAQELSDSHPGFRDRLADFFRECMKGIEGVVREGIRTGEFRRDLDPRATASLLFGALEGLMLVSKNLKEVAPLEAGFRQSLDLLEARTSGRRTRTERKKTWKPASRS